MDRRAKIILAFSLIVVTAALRLAPHAPNFAPVTASAIIASLYLSRRAALAVPLVVMAMTDVLIGFYAPALMVSVYGSFALIAALNSLSPRRDALALAFRSISGSLLFFFTTNFAVWQFGALYPHTALGLAQCFAMAVPFFRATFASDLFYVFVFAGIIQVFLSFVGLRRPAALALASH